MTAAQWICYFAFSLAELRDDLCFSEALAVGMDLLERFRGEAPEACAAVFCAMRIH